MEASKIIIGIQIILFAIAAVGLIYLVFRRLKKSKNENFEKRDN